MAESKLDAEAQQCSSSADMFFNANVRKLSILLLLFLVSCLGLGAAFWSGSGDKSIDLAKVASGYEVMQNAVMHCAASCISRSMLATGFVMALHHSLLLHSCCIETPHKPPVPHSTLCLTAHFA